MDTRYFRPLPQTGPVRPPGALGLAGGPVWFTHAEAIERGRPGQVIPAREIPAAVLARLTAPRAPVAGLTLERPRIMGILNVTPDSFSDGGRFLAPAAALAQVAAMGDADILDIGGESTRPGAATVPEPDEIARTAPVIAAVRNGFSGPISIDTRKAGVARAALAAGADMLNDVSALSFDPAMAPLAAGSGVPICLMHARGTPDVMQQSPRYDDVLLDVYDALARHVERAEAAGIPRTAIIVDPGIGFGKTLDHNLRLLSGLSLFHGLGCALLLGASRKRFIGTLSGVEAADRRVPGSLAVALAAAAQGAHILRVHDVAETRQALGLWRAATSGVGG